MILEYYSIFTFFILALVLVSLVFFLPYFVVLKEFDTEKISAYECGFNPFSDARGKFDVRYYLVAILFIIFDLEIMFMFPWALNLKYLGDMGFWSMYMFLIILLIGYMYEYGKGALDWD